MIKKRISVLFSTLAGLVFLLFTVLPHHHHHSQICFQNLHCHEHDVNSDNTLNGHNHDPKNEHAQCVLHLPCLLPSVNVISFIKAEEDFNIFSDSQISLFDYSKQQNVMLFAREDSPPGFTNFYTCLVNLSLGLRAPPSI